MASSSDPFTLVHDAIWAALWEHKPLARIVRPGNRVRFGSDARDLPPEEIAAADLPELRLVPSGGGAGSERASDGTSYLVRYTVGLATGDLMATGDRGVNALHFEVLRAMSGVASRLLALQYNGHQLVLTSSSGDVTQGVTDPEYNRGIRGWSALVQVEVKLWLTTADLAPVLA